MTRTLTLGVAATDLIEGRPNDVVLEDGFIGVRETEGQ